MGISGSATSSAGSTNGGSNTSQGPSGRELAIEALIDREPQGSFYRAARVVDDAVPVALASRPNLITRGALVEQAFSLSIYDIDTIDKYDEAYSSDNLLKTGGNCGSAESIVQPRAIDSLTKERILSFQTKLTAEKQKLFSLRDNASKLAKSSSSVGGNKPSIQTGNIVSVGPGAGLIAALRSVYDDSMSSPQSLSDAIPSMPTSFELRQLLQSVSSHPIFSSPILGHDCTASPDISISGAFNNRNKYQVNMEQILLQISKANEKDEEDYVQGLLIAILSVLTSQQPPKSAEQVDDLKKKSDTVVKPKGSHQQSESDDADALELCLQVGAILSLLPIESSAKGEKSDSTLSNSDPLLNKYKNYHLDSDLLDYYGNAAAIHEERLEIQKARMLARVQTPETPTTKRPDTPPPALIYSDLEANDTDRNLETRGDSEPILTMEMDADQLATVDHADAILHDLFDQVIASTPDRNEGADPNSDDPNVDDENMEVGGNNDVDDDESSEESGGDDMSDAVPVNDNGLTMPEEEVVADDGFHHPQPEQSDDDDAIVNEESSSSSSSSESSSEDGGIAESDQGLDTDEEDEAVLRQALAMSMTDQEEKDTNEEVARISSSDDTARMDTLSTEQGSGNMHVNEIPPIDAECPEPRTETPVSRTPSVDHRTPGKDGNDDEDNCNLPPYPIPPSSSLFSLGASGADSVHVIPDDPDASATTQCALKPELDPSSHGHFGLIPNSHVLLHLLRYSRQLVEQRRFLKVTHNACLVGRRVTAPSSVSPYAGAREDSQHSRSSVQHIDAPKSSVTLQLLLASFLLMNERRNIAVEKWREALAREHQVAQGGDGAHAAQGAAPLSSGEEDDPALTFALNYVEDDTPLSSESLENKGMRRKAAAALHDNAALLNSLRRQTDAWKSKVKFYSLCLGHSMALIRNFLQSVARHSLYKGSLSAEAIENNSVKKFADFLPGVVVSKISSALASLSTSFCSAIVCGVQGEVHGEDDFCQDVQLYKESILLWAECIPLTHTSMSSQSDILLLLMDQCSKRHAGENAFKFCFIAEVMSLPSSSVETSVHKLQALCRRLRCSDLLSLFVSAPMPFYCRSDDELSKQGESSTPPLIEIPDQPYLSRTVISKIGASLAQLIGGVTATSQLYLALRHRYHSKILLFDGFYATNEIEVDDAPPSASSSKMLSTGDTVRVSTAPSSALQFDSTKCHDSIAILTGLDGPVLSPGNNNGSSVNQRASKVWGTVLSSHFYSPKTGIHRWAVRLDKCERGHVFIGVATSQADVRTYVGGDKYGWGMIGTQALWHDRRKIRGDFGATFRTGSTIIITLDSDAGTLSFSCWRDSGTSSSFAMEPLVQNLLTPRLSGHVGGTVEDWGVAFEGLPLDSRLYPAVGLYQRDDRVTLLTVESCGVTSGSGELLTVAGGQCFYPRNVVAEVASQHSTYFDQLRRFNEQLAWDGVLYVTETLQQIAERLRSSEDDFDVVNVLPSLAAVLCLVPSTIPILSTRSALALMPVVSKFVMEVSRVKSLLGVEQRHFPLELHEGNWIIQAIGPGSSNEVDEYIVEINRSRSDGEYVIGFEGKGVGVSGKSKNGLVSIFGSSNGSLLSFVEEWAECSEEELAGPSATEASSCVVSARLSLDGRRFDGSYRKVQYGTIGQITGSLRESNQNGFSARKKDTPLEKKMAPILMCESLLCMAHSHLATVLVDDPSNDIEQVLASSFQLPKDSKFSPAHQLSLRDSLSGPLLSKCSLSLDQSLVKREVEQLKLMFNPSFATEDLIGVRFDNAVDAGGKTELKMTSISQVMEGVLLVDNLIAPRSGGLGSLRRICATEYDECRKRVACVLLRYCNLFDSIGLIAESSVIPDSVVDIWRWALKIMEDGIRNSLARPGDKTKSSCGVEVCDLYNQISTFLIDLEVDHQRSPSLTLSEMLPELALVYRTIVDNADIKFLQTEMRSCSQRGILRLVSLSETLDLLTALEATGTVAVESLIIGLPRQLGRGKPVLATMSRRDATTSRRIPDLDGSYDSGLLGCCSIIRKYLQSKVLALYKSLARIADDEMTRSTSTSTESSACVDSLMLAVLASFAGNIRLEDCEEIVLTSRLLSLLTKLFSAHVSSAAFDRVKAKTECDATSGMQDICRICQRDISRAILRCAVAVAHIVFYQVSVLVRSDGCDPLCTSACLSLLRCEIDSSLSVVKEMSQSIASEHDTKRREEEWFRWNKTVEPSKETAPEVKKDERVKKTESGIENIRRFGTLHGVSFQGNNSRQQYGSKAQVGGPMIRSNSELMSSSAGGFGHQFLSHWLHILCAVLRSSIFIGIISQDVAWRELLFSAIGLAAVHDANGTLLTLLPTDDCLLPARFRARTLRMLTPMFLTSAPSDAVAEGLFSLSGFASAIITASRYDVEPSVSRESISLLRHLHSPQHLPWRRCIIRTIARIVSLTDDCKSTFCKKIGVLAFFSGAIETIGRGSYVLLKPSAASALSSDHQQSGSGKGHPGGVGGSSISVPAIGTTPHHIAGNGTEAVITGLCRDEASAGIVSNIDMKNGICEVILVARDHKDLVGLTNCLDSSHAAVSASDRSPSSLRHSLTVRALRTPLSGVVLAQEVPLFPDNSLPVETLAGSMLSSSLKSLLTLMKSDYVALKEDVATTANEGNDSSETRIPEASLPESKGTHEGNGSSETNIPEAIVPESRKDAADLMIIRCAIVVLSDRGMLSSFLNLDNCRSILADVLSLAWPNAVGMASDSTHLLFTRNKGLSSLPCHEARYDHLLSLLRDLRRRSVLLENCTETERMRWLEEYHSKISMNSTEIAKMDDESVPASRSQPDSSKVESVSENPREIESTSNRSISQSTRGSNSEDEEETEAATTAAAHLREAAIAQMAELGLPRSWAELALRRTGGIDIEAAVTFCLERGGEIERLLAEERERDRLMQRDSVAGSSRRRGIRDIGPSNHLLRQLLEMGFPRRWCAEALAVNGNNVDEALTWILNNGERLSEEDEAIEAEGSAEVEEADDDSIDGEDEEDETEVGEDHCKDEVEAAADKKNEDAEASSVPTDSTFGWSGSVTPLRFISGRAQVDTRKMKISGLPAGGFSSVGTKGILLTSGKWYYEAILETAGCLQIGWADGSFAGHCHADRGDGCGDGPSSWAYDGWRRYRWHAIATEWGCRWKEGDVVGCMVDMDDHVVSFTLNGHGESIGMGVAFTGEGFRPCGGVYACVSFNRREKLRLILGGNANEPFKYDPPPGYRGVGEAVIDAVEEYRSLLAKEGVLDACQVPLSDEPKRFLCDFSDGEHGHELMAWAHRYYGSDASVHLGSGRAKQNSPKSSSSPSTEAKSKICITRRVDKVWAASFDESDPHTLDSDSRSILTQMRHGYEVVEKSIQTEIANECAAMAILLSRKLLLHILITLGSDFDPSFLIESDANEVSGIVRFFKVIEVCTSLRNAGWVGEAGAMAIAAEALGLGISSNDHMHSRSNGERSGIISAGDLDDGLILPTVGFTQLLTSVLALPVLDNATSFFPSASAEAAIGGEGGSGILAFLRDGLQSACAQSAAFRMVVVAAVKRSVRLLAVVEYDGEDFDVVDKQDDDDEEVADKNVDVRLPRRQRPEPIVDGSAESSQDARLTSFLTGLLLSRRVETTNSQYAEVVGELFEAWSVGLLSASLPWRMVCAFTAAGILNMNPSVFQSTIRSLPTLARFFGRLQSTVARRLWAERAATPVGSRYVQSLVELLSSVRRAVLSSRDLPDTFSRPWNQLDVDAATPVSFFKTLTVSPTTTNFWEPTDGWIASDSGWDVWSGSVEYMPVEWKTPSRSSVRTLMDGGDGPPMLREGCTVVRGVDWDDFHCELTSKNDDGRDIFDLEKSKRDEEKQRLLEFEKEAAQIECVEKEEESDEGKSSNPAQEIQNDGSLVENKGSKSKKKRSKVPSPKLALGIVISIEPWKGIPGMACRVLWNLTGIEGVYRYGGDGGRFDVCHVESNAKETRIKKRHPLPESREQCASRHGFGVGKVYPVLLRLRRQGESISNESKSMHEGVLEWPDFGAGVRVACTLHKDGAVTIEENDLLFGSKDSGWEARFGQPSFVAGSVFGLSPSKLSSSVNQVHRDIKSSSLSQFEELLGSYCFDVDFLRNPENGTKIQVVSEMRLYRGRVMCHPFDFASLPSPSVPPLLGFDRACHAPSLSLSRDGRTVSCSSSDGRGTAFAAMGFTKGVHYWEVKLEQADIGSVFVGVAEKPAGSGSGSSFVCDTLPRLNKWHGWGFVNFRATYTSGAERVYGSHCNAGDTVGVLLDCDAGRVSFFFDGLKYGEHILNDLGCAFENLSPFGFNVDGCGSGGAGQGAPSAFENGPSGRYPAQGTIRPRTLWPVIGLRNQGDRVTISSKWNSAYGVDGTVALKNVLAVDSILNSYVDSSSPETALVKTPSFPKWFISEAYSEFLRWSGEKWSRSASRGCGQHRLSSFGLDLLLDASPIACAAACASLGLDVVLLSGDRVRLKRSAGRILELAEEAVVLGAYQGRLYYRIVSQKSEGGSLTEGGGRAWCWDESEVVDGLPLISRNRSLGVKLPKLSRFRCRSSAGLRVVYENGAVVRSDIEIFDGSINLGTIPASKVIPKNDVLERRVNSCGVERFLVRYEGIGEGWISARIRGGTEESIVEGVHMEEGHEVDASPQDVSFSTPAESAYKWFNEWSNHPENKNCLPSHDFRVECVEDFERLIAEGVVPEMTAAESDAMLASAVAVVCNHVGDGDAVECPFTHVASALSYVLTCCSSEPSPRIDASSAAANQAAASIFMKHTSKLPSLPALLARVAVLRAINRRARYALPWLSIRPCQEGSALFGGLCGHGTSVDRVGRARFREKEKSWINVPSISGLIRMLRGIFFTSIKMEFLQSITDATTTPTPLSHDEYELPREIRTVRINRLKAGRAMLSDDASAKRKYSVFAQLQNETKNWGGASLRRGYVAKGHGGQKRAFKVKLIGEGVNDYSGPYREVFTDAISEVLKPTSSGGGVLGVLDPTPNNYAAVGDHRELFMFSLNGRELHHALFSPTHRSSAEKYIRMGFASLMTARDEASREVEEALVFLGRVAGTAYRHRIPLDLPLPLASVWSALTEETASASEKLRELDFLAYRQLPADDDADESMLVLWQQRMLNSFAEGLSNVLPVEVLPLFTGVELRDAICGNPDVDVELLKQVVEYEGYDASDKVIGYFWETIQGMSSQERKQFLQFVWARNRLPVRASDFEAPFKIQRDSLNSGAKSDQALPSASTCFFSLTLPDYSSPDLLKEKLLFAINNVTTMETDFQTNSAEIAEGYRTF